MTSDNSPNANIVWSPIAIQNNCWVTFRICKCKKKMAWHPICWKWPFVSSVIGRKCQDSTNGTVIFRINKRFCIYSSFNTTLVTKEVYQWVSIHELHLLYLAQQNMADNYVDVFTDYLSSSITKLACSLLISLFFKTNSLPNQTFPVTHIISDTIWHYDI